MKLSTSAQWQLLAILLFAVALAFSWGRIFGHRAWAQGTSTVLGHIDDIQASRRVRVIRYSYVVDGKSYKGEITDRHAFISNVPAMVTYATSDPSVSTLQPEQMDALYRNSLIVVGICALPMLWLWAAGIRNLLRRPPPSET